MDESHDQDHDQRVATGDGTSVLGAILRHRLPIWVTLVVTLVAVVALGASWLLRSVPDLGPAPDQAERVEVVVHACNEVVDARGYNPRAAELKFERTLRSLGAKAVDVEIRRRDCR